MNVEKYVIKNTLGDGHTYFQVKFVTVRKWSMFNSEKTDPIIFCSYNAAKKYADLVEKPATYGWKRKIGYGNQIMKIFYIYPKNEIMSQYDKYLHEYRKYYKEIREEFPRLFPDIGKLGGISNLIISDYPDVPLYVLYLDDGENGNHVISNSYGTYPYVIALGHGSSWKDEISENVAIKVCKPIFGDGGGIIYPVYDGDNAEKVETHFVNCTKCFIELLDKYFTYKQKDQLRTTIVSSSSIKISSEEGEDPQEYENRINDLLIKHKLNALDRETNDLDKKRTEVIINEIKRTNEYQEYLKRML